MFFIFIILIVTPVNDRTVVHMVAINSFATYTSVLKKVHKAILIVSR